MFIASYHQKNVTGNNKQKNKLSSKAQPPVTEAYLTNDLLQALVLRNKANLFRCGILFDPGVQPIMDKHKMQTAFKPASIGYCSDQFLNWTQSFNLVPQLCSKAMPGVTATLTSVTRSDHQTQSDTPVKLEFM